MKSHKKSAMDDNFVLLLAFDTADQVVPDQVVEELSLSCLNINEDGVENNTEIENTENSTQFEFVEVEINPTEEVNSRNVYHQKYRERKRKVHSLEEIVQSLSSPQKNKVKEVSVEDSQSFQSSLVNDTICYLKSLWKKGSYPEFHKFYLNFFADILEDDYFMKQFAKSLDIRSYFLQSLNKYKSSNFAERRGRHKFKERQLDYYMWTDQSIPSTDGRNGRNIITISKCCFLLFTNLNQKVLIKEKVNKHGQTVFQSPRMIATSTVCGVYWYINIIKTILH